jgi:hypothetical protein
MLSPIDVSSLMLKLCQGKAICGPLKAFSAQRALAVQNPQSPSKMSVATPGR